MKKHLLLSALLALTGPLLAADSSPKDDVQAAAKKLADADNYTWTSTVEFTGGRFRPGPTTGKINKEGLILLSMTRGDNTIEAVVKGDKGAVKTQDGWQSFAEMAANQDQPRRGRFMARMLRNYKAPAAEITDLLGKVKDLQSADGVCSGALTEDGAKQLLSFRRGGRRGGGGNGPEISGAKGTVKFWVTDGALTKYQIHVQGTISFNGNDRDIDRTTTVEIKDVGSTTLSVPDEAAKKIS
jgi:hypothetical protein